MKLSDKDKRTIRFAAIALGIYLVLFFGFKAWKQLENRRAEYRALLQEAELLESQFEAYETKGLLIAKLRGNAGMDISTFSRVKVVGETSEAIQKAAQSGGIKLGQIREAPGNASSGEMASMQMEATGPIQNVLAFLHQLEDVGYPLIVNSVEIQSGQRQPGQISVSLEMVLLDYEQWKPEERRRDA